VRAQADINDTIKETAALLDGFLQEQANQIVELAENPKKRLEINAPADFQSAVAEEQSHIDKKIKELFTDSEALDHALVRDTLQEKIELLQRR